MNLFRMIRLKMCFLLLLATLAVFQGACTKKAANVLTENTFIGSQGDDVKTFDPANAYDSISLDLVPMIYETLYQYEYLSESYKIIPLLAADMPIVSKDRLTLTIPIRRGIKFQDDPAFEGGKGRELKASDFVFGFKRLADPDVRSQGWWIFDGKLLGITEFHEKMVNAEKAERKKIFASDVEGVTAVNDYTLQIKLVKPYPQLLFMLAMPFTSPVAHEVVTKYGDEKGNIHDKPVGTGPYVLKTWERGHRVVLERNLNYHPEFYPVKADPKFVERGYLADSGKQIPFIDKFVYKIVKEPQPQWLGFMKGEFDVMGIPKDNFATAITDRVQLSPELKKKGIQLQVNPGARFYYISFNMRDRLFDQNKLQSKYLRQAISSVIDRQKWIDTFTNGRGIKMVNALPPGLPDRPQKSVLKYDFNVERAKDLMSKAGFAGGIDPETKKPLQINFDMRGADSVNRQMGDFFTRQFAEIGIKLNVIYNTFPAFLEKLKSGNLQLSYGGWGLDYPDPENVYQLLYGPNKSPGPNETQFNHPEMNKLYEQMASMESGVEREAVIQKMDEILQEEVPWALGYIVTDYELNQAWVLNYRGDGIITNKQKYWKLDLQVKKRLEPEFK